MPKVSPIQNLFNSGELSPLLDGRTDFDNYKGGLKTCLNHLPLIQGPVTRRPGSYFVDEVKDSTKATRVVAFKFSTTQAYIIEFGDLYVRFKRDNGPVLLTSQALTAATKANPCVVTYTGTDTYANGDHVDISGVGGMTELNGRRYKVANVDTGANTFELQDVAGTNVNSMAFTTLTLSGVIEEVYQVTTPYVEAHLFQLKFTQSADVLYITHPSYWPRKLTRSAHTSWTLTSMYNLFLDGPYLGVNATATTLTLSGVSGSVTVTASAITGINSDTGFQTTDVDRLIRWKDPAGNWTWLQITARASTTSVTATIRGPNASAGTATANWRLGVWSDTTGFPTAVTFYEDRLAFGGSTSYPDRIDLSKTGDYEIMAPSNAAGTIADDNALAFTLRSDDVQAIRWMKGEEKALAIGTVDGEWTVRPSSQGEALTPTNVSAKQSTARGSANIQALQTGESLIFVQTAGRQLRERAYVFESDKFRTPDMTVLSEHITKAATAATSGIKELAYQKQPQSIVWAVRNDGVLLSFTYERDQKVLAWARHVLGGYSNSGHTANALVESVASIPSADGTRDEVWLVVKRYINGRTVRYVEYLTKIWEADDVQEDAVYGDCALTYDGVSAGTITGLWHLAGETIKVLVNGAAHTDEVVSATGTITLDAAATVVQVGYGYNSDGQMLRIDAGAADGTAQGKLQRTHRAIFRLHDTLGLKVGTKFTTSGYGKLTEQTFRTSAMDTDEAVPLFSGDKEVAWEGSYTSDNYVCWRFDGMFPGTVEAVMPQLHTQDR